MTDYSRLIESMQSDGPYGAYQRVDYADLAAAMQRGSSVRGWHRWNEPVVPRQDVGLRLVRLRNGYTATLNAAEWGRRHSFNFLGIVHSGAHDFAWAWNAAGMSIDTADRAFDIVEMPATESAPPPAYHWLGREAEALNG